MCQDQ